MKNILNDKNKLSEFESVAKISNSYLKKAKITLDFTGYKSFFKKYFEVREDDIESIFELIKESLAWSNYLSEVRSLVNIFHLNIIVEKEYSHNKRIENGIKYIKLFLNHLEIQIRYCNLIHKEMIELYNKNIYKLTFRSSY